jgi:DNA-binding transcriptional regulator/RsmH inhibitor MraZ
MQIVKPNMQTPENDLDTKGRVSMPRKRFSNRVVKKEIIWKLSRRA